MTKAVSKEIHKLKKIPHPKSRKTAQLTRKVIRSAAREKSKNINLMKQNVIGEKFLWFKENLELNDFMTPAMVLELVERYLARFDEELEQIKIKHTIKHRKGRQHASREDIIKMTKTHELNDFNTCGIEMPDLLNPKQLSMLVTWSGELRFLPNFKIVRYNRARLESLIKKHQSNKDKKEEEEEGDLGMDVEEMVDASQEELSSEAEVTQEKQEESMPGLGEGEKSVHDSSAKEEFVT